MKSNGRFQDALCSVYRLKTCVTGMDENKHAGIMPANRKTSNTTKKGIHNVCMANKEASRTAAISSTKSAKRYINSPTPAMDNNTINAVSVRNMPNTVPAEAPLHLCTPISLARWDKEETDIST